jgi:hypothetical protein
VEAVVEKKKVGEGEDSPFIGKQVRMWVFGGLDSPARKAYHMTIDARITDLISPLTRKGVCDSWKGASHDHGSCSHRNQSTMNEQQRQKQGGKPRA